MFPRCCWVGSTHWKYDPTILYPILSLFYQLVISTCYIHVLQLLPFSDQLDICFINLLYPCFINLLYHCFINLLYHCFINLLYQLVISMLYPCFTTSTLFRSTRYLFYQLVISLFYPRIISCFNLLYHFLPPELFFLPFELFCACFFPEARLRFFLDSSFPSCSSSLAP